MTLSLTLSWWIFPLLVTVALFTWAIWIRQSDLGGFIPSPMPLFRVVAAIIGALVAWLIWALVA